MIYPGSPDCTSSLCCCLLWITVYSSYFLSTPLVDACYFSWGLYTNTVPFLRFNQDPPCFWITNGLMHSQLIWFEIVVYFFFSFYMFLLNALQVIGTRIYIWGVTNYEENPYKIWKSWAAVTWGPDSSCCRWICMCLFVISG